MLSYKQNSAYHFFFAACYSLGKAREEEATSEAPQSQLQRDGETIAAALSFQPRNPAPRGQTSTSHMYDRFESTLANELD